LFNKIKEPIPYAVFINIAETLRQKGEIEKSLEYTKKTIDIYRDLGISKKPLDLTIQSWRKQQKIILGLALSTYANGLLKLGKTQEAEKYFEEALSFNKGESLGFNENFIQCYLKNEKFEKAITFSIECIKKGRETEKLIEYYKQAYVKVNGSDQGFNEKVNDLRGAVRKEMKEKLIKTMVNKPEIDFNLKGLDGKYIKLSDLKGKVVVLDFWATWCGPCKSSFPALQKIYNKYLDNPNIAILTLDTQESVKDEEREKLVKKFIEENKYTFPVLFDEDYADKYDVTGNIRFKNVGFGDEKGMIDELTLQLEILLSDDYK
jgi:thiol-disulfide isomerase/thioredoxin